MELDPGGEDAAGWVLPGLDHRHVFARYCQQLRDVPVGEIQEQPRAAEEVGGEHGRKPYVCS